MHERLQEATRKIGVTKARQTVACLGKVVWRETLKKSFFQAKEEQEQTFHKRSALRESLLSAWKADITRRCQSARIGKLRFTPPKCPVCRGTEGKTRGEAEWL